MWRSIADRGHTRRQNRTDSKTVMKFILRDVISLTRFPSSLVLRRDRSRYFRVSSKYLIIWALKAEVGNLSKQFLPSIHSRSFDNFTEAFSVLLLAPTTATLARLVSLHHVFALALLFFPPQPSYFILLLYNFAFTSFKLSFFIDFLPSIYFLPFFFKLTPFHPLLRFYKIYRLTSSNLQNRIFWGNWTLPERKIFRTVFRRCIRKYESKQITKIAQKDSDDIWNDTNIFRSHDAVWYLLKNIISVFNDFIYCA